MIEILQKLTNWKSGYEILIPSERSKILKDLGEVKSNLLNLEKEELYTMQVYVNAHYDAFKNFAPMAAIITLCGILLTWISKEVIPTRYSYIYVSAIYMFALISIGLLLIKYVFNMTKVSMLRNLLNDCIRIKNDETRKYPIPRN